jgi:acetoin utilization deacetylase AcuC-like enzyme
VVVHHRQYSAHPSGPLIDHNRTDKILAFLTHEHLVRNQDVHRPYPASLEHVLRVHDGAYVESLADPEVVGKVMGRSLTLAETHEAVDLARLMVGGTIRAAGLARRTGQTVAHLGGGFHHATADEGMGFCLLNDIAIAISRLRSNGYDAPILVVDLDLHDGNGTRDVFAADPSVYTYSIHNIPWSEDTAVASTSIALGSGVDDDRLLSTLRDTLPDVVHQHHPELVFFVAGVDGAASDALGDWQLTADGILERDRFVIEAVRAEASPPIVMLLAGGYGTSAWRYTARTLASVSSGEVVDPPDEADIVLERFRRISSGWKTRVSEADDNDWGLTEEDLLGIVTHQDTLFLSTYSRHTLELQLAELGVLDRIRARGYRTPRLSLDAPRGLGQVLRLHGDARRSELLMELKAGRSRSAVPNFEVIEVEWLRLQDPRAAFSSARPQLPGQHHPGLGILRDVVGWLIIVCERLRLDGIAFVPSQYYMAAVGYRHLKFLDPQAQGRFEALRRALRSLRISQANHALETGGVFDEGTGAPVRWVPALGVLPVSDELRRCVHDRKYRDAVADARRAARFVLRELPSGHPQIIPGTPTKPTLP